MNYTNVTNHPKTHSFENHELLALTPEDIYKFMAKKAFGKPDPNLEVDQPVCGQSSSLEFTKKAISFFMPNRLIPWNEETRSGNPTRSTIINDFIKSVKVLEVRKQGKASNARRPLECSEFTALVERLRGDQNNLKRHTLAAYVIFQYSIIARVDDVMHFTHEDILPNLEYDFALKCKMCWNKNVLEERDAPDQILLAAMDPRFCSILALAVHLEHAFHYGTISTSPSSKLFGISKEVVANRLKVIFNDSSFPKASDGPVGTHSIRKFPATYARRNGCSRDDVDARGRWKRNKRIVDTYIDVSLPYPDAKVAATLCIGGAVKYGIQAESGVSDDWILQNVCPNVGSIYPRRVAVVLGRALLWAIYDQAFSEILDQELCVRVKTVANQLNSRLEPSANPIRKLPLVVTGHDGVLTIAELSDEGDEGNLGATTSGPNSSAELRLLLSAVTSLRKQNDDLKNEINIFKLSNNAMLQNMNNSIRRLAMTPVTIPRQRQTTHREESTVSTTAVPFTVTLCKWPKTLFVLWQDYQFGVGGRKAAKLFTAAERGKVKFNYSLRKPFWD